MRDHDIRSAPNYTVPALVMGCINLICVFFVIWAAFGMIAALVLAALLHHAIDRFAASRAGL